MDGMLADYGLGAWEGNTLEVRIGKDTTPVAYFSPWRNEFCIGVEFPNDMNKAVIVEFMVAASGRTLPPGAKIIGGGDVGAVPMFVVARTVEG